MLLSAALPQPALPTALFPPAPFPALIAQDVAFEPVAPGISRATYRLATAAGPLVVSVVCVNVHEPSIRLGTVLANERIVSKDETTSSMARRTGAVAGINGDYYDIGATGAPVGVLVRNGSLLRTPSARVALTVTNDRSVRFEPYRFAGSVSTRGGIVPLSAVDEWPPQAGATLLTPVFGAIPSSPAGVTVLDLQPLAGNSRYRVSAVTNAPPWPSAPALRLAYGPAAQALAPVPDIGDVVDIAYDTDPPLASVAAAIGGGPLLLRGGTPIDDPLSPNYADRERRIPAAAAGTLADGSLLLVVADGRHPATSIGVNRAELIALLRALGATDAMLFDSGGSATLVARVLGDATPSVVNEPSDGVERPVADGLFVYSDAPAGPPAQLVVRPARIVALPGARVALKSRIVDASLHGLGDARGPWQIASSPLAAGIARDDVLQVGATLGSAELRVRRDGLAGTIRLETIARPARIVIGPPRVNPNPHAIVALTAQAFDARDRPVAIDGVVRWSARDAAIDERGNLHAGDRDVLVAASAGGVRSVAVIPVGRHDAPLALFDDAHRASWQLAAVPPNAGTSTLGIEGERLQLSYDFSGGARAVSATASIALGAPLSIACAVDGDAGGTALRLALSDRYGDRQSLQLARTIDFNGTRRVSVTVPLALAPPLAMRAFTILRMPANAAFATSGSIAVHDCVGTFPGMNAQTDPPTKSTAPSTRSHVNGAAATASAG